MSPFTSSEHLWRDAGGGRPSRRHGGRSLDGAELCRPGGAAVTVPRHGVCRATAAGAAGETATVAEAAAAGNKAAGKATFNGKKLAPLSSVNTQYQASYMSVKHNQTKAKQICTFLCF